MTRFNSTLLTCLITSCAALALAGCATPHSQQVRNDAKDRFDRAGAQIVYDQARQSFTSGQFDEALGHIEKAIVRFPKDSSYYLLRGRILNEMKRTDQARDSFARAVELDPRKPEPHYFLGIVYQRWRQPEDALSEYAKASALDPAKLHYVCAEVELLTALARYDEAEARIEAVSKRFEYSPVIDRLRADVAKCRGNDALCADLLERAAIREDADAPGLEELAYARYAGRDWVGVLNTLNDPRLKSVVARADMVRLRARCLLMLGRATEARDALLAIRSEPDSTGRTLVLLGNAAWRAGDWTCVRDCGRALVLSNPALADGYLFLGGADFAAGRMTDSVSYFEQAVARDPERESTKRMLAESTARLAQGGGVQTPINVDTAAGAMRTEAAP